MRAFLVHDYGAPSALKLEETPDPSPEAGEVILDVEAAGLGYVDALLVAGRYQVKTPLPFIPGSEVAGRISAVGEGVSEGLIGQDVMGLSPRGALAEKLAVPAAVCLSRPAGLSAEAAAGFLVSYCTALYGFKDCGALQPGERVLVLGAAGGVGMAAIDLAKGMGAEVIAAASTQEKRQAAIARGADFAIDYTDHDWRKQLEPVTGRKDVDVVYDPVGGAHSETAFRCLAPGGRHLVVGFAAGEIPKLPLNLALLKRASLVGVDWGGHVRADPTANAPLLKELAVMISEGRISPSADQVFPFEEAPDVLQRLLDRTSLGKPVIRVSA